MGFISAFKEAHKNLFYLITVLISVTVVVGVRNQVVNGSPTQLGPTPAKIIQETTEKKTIWTFSYNDNNFYLYFLNDKDVLYSDDLSNFSMAYKYPEYDKWTNGEKCSYSLSNNQLIINQPSDGDDTNGESLTITFSNLQLDSHNNIQAQVSAKPTNDSDNRSVNGISVVLNNTGRTPDDKYFENN
ncbi:MAG: hypothetical protein M3005_00345 [Apilactobacillus sp.]|uniref:hypothetical protein n=1 Tax=Apilactobacillus TaxID=2767877 RepID=UPI0025F32DA3|nr:hypothetical protein [Apilactobacillus sp.]MCT6822305.1 hypothetical protein [Apilactobacillus sp.]MCT6857647.1 hypothetical protein [Apilactobacillus sp.]